MQKVNTLTCMWKIATVVNSERQWPLNHIHPLNIHVVPIHTIAIVSWIVLPIQIESPDKQFYSCDNYYEHNRAVGVQRDMIMTRQQCIAVVGCNWPYPWMFGILAPLLDSGRVSDITWTITGPQRSLPVEVWALSGGNELPCEYMLSNVKMDCSSVMTTLWQAQDEKKSRKWKRTD